MKRFTETSKWSDPWFRRLPSRVKNLWCYMHDNCDSAGVIDLDLELASFLITEQVTSDDLVLFGDRIVLLENGKIHIPGFIPFQYGTLSKTCKPHKSAFDSLARHGIDPKVFDTLPIPFRKVQEEEKDKEEEPEKNPWEEGMQGEKPRSGGIPRSEQQAVEWSSMDAVPIEFSKAVFHQCEGTNWIDGAGRSITNWRSYVRSRFSRQQTVTGSVNVKPLSVLDLKTVIAAKEKLALDFKNKHASEGPMGMSWTDPVKRQEWRKLREEIKTLTMQLSKMA